MRIIVCETEKQQHIALRQQSTMFSMKENVELEVIWLGTEHMREQLGNHLPGAQIVLMPMRLGDRDALATLVHQTSMQCCLLIYGGTLEQLPHWIPSGPVSWCKELEGIAPELSRLFRQIAASQFVFPFQFRRETNYMYYSDILYFQSNLRKVELVCRSGEVHSFLDKLDMVEARLPSSCFLRIHKSHLVNLMFVRKLDRAAREVELMDGTRLPISAHYDKTVAERLTDVASLTM